MRLWRYVVAELAVAAGLVAGAGYAGTLAVSAVVHRLEGAAERARDGAAALPPRGDISDPPDIAINEESSGTFLGMADELLLQRVRSQPIVRMKLNKGGSSLSFRVDFADGSHAAFKPAQTNLQTIPRKEVAAYRLNRFLGLNAVPPAAPRLVTRDELFAHLHADSLVALPRIRAQTIFDPTGRTAGVAMYWVPQIKDCELDTAEGLKESLGWLAQGAPIPPPRLHMAEQVSNLVVFDFLTSNPDRHSGGNMKMSPDGDRLYFMDNTLAFFLDPEGNDKTRPILQRAQRFSRRLYEATGRISVPALEQLLADARPGSDPGSVPILTAAEIRAVVARRDALRRHVEGLLALHGDRNVLFFP